MISFKTVLRKKKLDTNKYPIYLRITKDRKTIFFRTPYTSLETEWDKKQGKFNKNSTDYLNKNRLLLKFTDKAISVVTELEQNKSDYTLLDIEKTLRIEANPTGKVIYLFWQEIINEQKTAGRTGNARIHSDTLKSVKKFSKIKELTFHEITPEFLEKYESWLRSKGGTDGGIGVKMRSIRAIFNTAIIRGRVKGDIYPFKTYKISKLKGKGIKKALKLEDVQKIAQLDLDEHQTLVDTRNYFIFSFYSRGMNFADMANLKWSDISDGRIYYTRSKTKGNFQIKILPPVQEILDYYKGKRNQTDYVFPILLEKDMTFSHLENRKSKVLKKYNKRLKEIASLCEIDKPVSSYVARHSYANCLKQKGISTDIISESMGHQNIAITQAYLKELDSSMIDEAMEVLL